MRKKKGIIYLSSFLLFLFPVGQDSPPGNKFTCLSRLSGLSVTDQPAVSHPELYLNQIVKGGVFEDRWGVNQSQGLKGSGRFTRFVSLYDT